MEDIEQIHLGLKKYVASLHEHYNLDPNSEYQLKFPEKPEEKATFIKN